MTGYKVIPARYPELVRLTGAELEEKAKKDKRAKQELERRKANRAAKRNWKKGGSK
jgi:hypothetical protein